MSEYEFKRGKLISIHFENMTDMMDVIADKTKTTSVNIRKLEDILGEYHSNPDWFGGTSQYTRDVLSKSVDGDHNLYRSSLVPMIDQLNQLIQIKDNINEVPILRRKKVNKQFGDELDIHKVYQGKLDTAWRTTERVEFDQEHHLITLLIDIGGNCNIDAKDTLWVAASCLKVVSDIERSGKSVQIIVGGAATTVTTNGSDMTVTCTVKKYNEHLSVERLAAMSHIGFYRSACFIGKTLNQEKLQWNLGYSATLQQLVPIPIQDEINNGKTKIVNIPKALNLDQAVRSIKRAEADLLKNASA